MLENASGRKSRHGLVCVVKLASGGIVGVLMPRCWEKRQRSEIETRVSVRGKARQRWNRGRPHASMLENVSGRKSRHELVCVVKLASCRLFVGTR